MIYMYKEATTLATLVESETLSKHDVLLIENELKERGNIVVFGQVGMGKTTILEAIIRAKIELHPDNRYCYIPVYKEKDFSEGSLIVTLSQSDSSISSQARVALKMGADTIFIDEVRTHQDVLAVEFLMRTGKQVIFTTHAATLSSLIEKLKTLLLAYEGDDADKIFGSIVDNLELIIHAQR